VLNNRYHRSLIVGFLLPGIILTIVGIVLPLLYAVYLSFFKLESFVGVPKFVGLSNYADALTDKRFWMATYHGLVYSLTTIFFQVVSGILFALVLNESFRGKAFVRGLVVLPYILPTIVVTLVWGWLMDGNIGLITSILHRFGLPAIDWMSSPGMAMATIIFVSTWTWTPFVTVCFLAALQTVPEDLYGAARVDGTTAIQRFFYITIPVVKPVLVVIVLLRGIWMFNKFDIIWLMTKGGPIESTEHIPALAYIKAFTLFDIGSGAAIATLGFVFLAIMVWAYFKLFPMED
jgi:multiple sugar transport system permease protein